MEKSFPKTKEYMVPQIYEYILHRSGDKSVQNDKTGIQRMLQNFNGAFTEEQLRENMEKYNLTKMFELVKKYFKREYDYEDDSIILSNNYQQSINSYLYDDQVNPIFIHIDELLESTMIAFLAAAFKWSKEFENLEVYGEYFKYVLFLLNDVCIFGKMQGVEANNALLKRCPTIPRFYSLQKAAIGRFWFSVWPMKWHMHISHISERSIRKNISKEKNMMQIWWPMTLF